MSYSEGTSVLSVLALLAVHALLGIVLDHYSVLATIHALLSVAAALWFALFSPSLERILCGAAYIVGAETLWRMSDSQMAYEGGKYAVAVVFIIALVRLPRYRIPIGAVLYATVLLPSALITSFTLSGQALRQLLSSNLSGPFLLVLAVTFLSNCRLSMQSMQQVWLSLIYPLTGVAAAVMFGTFSRSEINFGTSSMYETSGGFGPNQVSAVLGLGAVLCFLLVCHTTNRVLRNIAFLGMIVFLAQAALTFSRGGVYAAFGAMLPALFHMGRHRGRTSNVLGLVVLMILVFGLVVYPLLDAFTGGQLAARYEKRGVTGRDTLMMMDLLLWSEHPVFGIGVGMSKQEHGKLGFAGMTHNEYTRLLAEHGSLGLCALVFLVLLVISRWLEARTLQEKAIVAAMLTWSIMFTGANGMRIAAAGFVFGLAFFRLPDLRPYVPVASRQYFQAGQEVGHAV